MVFGESKHGSIQRNFSKQELIKRSLNFEKTIQQVARQDALKVSLFET